MEVFNTRVRKRIDLKIEIAPSFYVTQIIFEKYIDKVLVPVLISNRDIIGYKDNPAILFRDDCSVHCSDAILTSWLNMILWLLLISRMHLISLRYLMCSCSESWNWPTNTRDQAMRRQVSHILWFRSYEHAAIGITIRFPWKQTGYEYDRRDNATCPCVPLVHQGDDC
jgi:hypothetical protein